MAFPRLHRTIVFIALLVQAGCSDVTGPESEFYRARAKWEAARPVGYDYTLHLSCYCGGDVARAVVITVHAYVIESRTFADDGTAVPAQFHDAFPMIDGMFDVIADAMERDAAEINVSYDPVLGYPTAIAIDYSTRISDEEVSYTIANFHGR